MGGAIDITDRVDRIITRLLGLGDPEIEWLADALQIWRAGGEWDISLGLASGWFRVVAQRDRDRALAGILAGLQPAKARDLSRQVAAILRRHDGNKSVSDRKYLSAEEEQVRMHARDFLAAGGSACTETLRKEPEILRKAIGCRTNWRSPSANATFPSDDGARHGVDGETKRN